jgi:hypothetical protein
MPPTEASPVKGIELSGSKSDDDGDNWDNSGDCFFRRGIKISRDECGSTGR